MNDCLNLTDVSQELVSQSFSLAGALNQACNVTELNCRIYSLPGIVYFRKLCHSLVRYGNNTHIRLDGAERVVGRFRSGLCDGVKKGALANIRQSYYSEFH